MIEGIEIKELTTHSDGRGFFREILRGSDPIFKEGFGQWSHSLMYDGVIKAWHFHNIQTDWFYVASGVMRVGLADLREDSPTYKETMSIIMGDMQAAQIVKIPPGIAHGAQTIQGPVNLFYLTSHEYDPNDEIRIPYDSKDIDFKWTDWREVT